MGDQINISDYNCFDVEDFSVDSFFRSLELQSRYSSNDLEFSFPAYLENVPISSCLTSVSFLDTDTAKSSHGAGELSATEQNDKCRSRFRDTATETSSIAGLTDDDDNATAVDVFFRSLQLQSCLLRGTEDETTHNSPSCDPDRAKTSSCGGDLWTHTQHVDMTADCSVRDGSDQNLPTVNKEIQVSTDHGNQWSDKSSANRDYLSSTWICSNDTELKDYQQTQNSSSAHAVQSQTRQTESLTYQKDSGGGQICSKGQLGEVAKTKDNRHDGSVDRQLLKSGEMNCVVCGVVLSSKYSYVRHLLTPLHQRRADGYCNATSPSTVAVENHTDDIVRLISKQKPVQCRVCCFYGDTTSQLLQHLTSSSHYGQAKRKLLQCVVCQFAGTCDDIVTHVKSDSHATLVKEFRQPSVVIARRRRQRRGQATEDCKSCNLCDKKFPSTSSLEIHIRRRHTGQRPFTCSLCCKAYCDNSTLRLHYKTAQHRHKSAVLQ